MEETITWNRGEMFKVRFNMTKYKVFLKEEVPA
jgi:hypothetical protein